MRSLGGTAAVLTTTAALLLGGCSSSGEDEAGTSDSSTTSQESGSGTDEDTGDTGDTSADLPEGFTLVAISDSGYSVGVPEDWQAVDAAAITEQGLDSPEAAEAAESLGVTTEQLGSAIGQAQLLVVGPKEDTGYAPTVTVNRSAAPELPTAETLETELAQLSPDGVDTLESDTGVGPAITATLFQTVQDFDVITYDSYVETPDGVLELAVSATDGGTSSDVSDALLASITDS